MTQQTVPQGPPANNGTQVVIEKENESLFVFAFEGEKASAEAIAGYLGSLWATSPERGAKDEICSE
jgi:hypothetical protein